ncbi:hypothetical protein IKG16_02170 [Candidatus Saccharibacteria bacterium]|nr:hypothetical protein [Candidatus Saccharibacteria bacterium]
MANHKIGDVKYHPLGKDTSRPFGLYIEGNSTFNDYDNVPLTIFTLSQKVISTAANDYSEPVWLSFCISKEGDYLPFSSTLTNYPDNRAVPVIINGKLLRHDDKRRRTWPAIIKKPTEDGGQKLEEVFVAYERGSIISASDVYGERDVYGE